MLTPSLIQFGVRPRPQESNRLGLSCRSTAVSSFGQLAPPKPPRILVKGYRLHPRCARIGPICCAPFPCRLVVAFSASAAFSLDFICWPRHDSGQRAFESRMRGCDEPDSDRPTTLLNPWSIREAARRPSFARRPDIQLAVGKTLGFNFFAARRLRPLGHFHGRRGEGMDGRTRFSTEDPSGFRDRRRIPRWSAAMVRPGKPHDLACLRHPAKGGWTPKNFGRKRPRMA